MGWLFPILTDMGWLSPILTDIGWLSPIFTAIDWLSLVLAEEEKWRIVQEKKSVSPEMPNNQPNWNYTFNNLILVRSPALCRLSLQLALPLLITPTPTIASLNPVFQSRICIDRERVVSGGVGPAPYPGHFDILNKQLTVTSVSKRLLHLPNSQSEKKCRCWIKKQRGPLTL